MGRSQTSKRRFQLCPDFAGLAAGCDACALTDGECQEEPAPLQRFPFLRRQRPVPQEARQTSQVSSQQLAPVLARSLARSNRAACPMACYRNSHLTNAKLKLVCSILDLGKNGTQSELVDRIMTFLVEPKDSGKVSDCSVTRTRLPSCCSLRVAARRLSLKS